MFAPDAGLALLTVLVNDRSDKMAPVGVINRSARWKVSLSCDGKISQISSRHVPCAFCPSKLFSVWLGRTVF